MERGQLDNARPLNVAQIGVDGDDSRAGHTLPVALQSRLIERLVTILAAAYRDRDKVVHGKIECRREFREDRGIATLSKQVHRDCLRQTGQSGLIQMWQLNSPTDGAIWADLVVTADVAINFRATYYRFVQMEV